MKTGIPLRYAVCVGSRVVVLNPRHDTSRKSKSGHQAKEYPSNHSPLTSHCTIMWH